MKTIVKTIGFNNGYRTAGRQAGCNATGFLSQPCNRFEMPSTKRSNRTAGTRTVTRQKRGAFDEEIIARKPLIVRILLCALALVVCSILLQMAIAAFVRHLPDPYGFYATLLCFGGASALIVRLWRL